MIAVVILNALCVLGAPLRPEASGFAAPTIGRKDRKGDATCAKFGGYFFSFFVAFFVAVFLGTAFLVTAFFAAFFINASGI